ncbi:MAG: bacteriocin [Flavobacterium sp.]|nr:bacteriocin [Flavobacterium sp.]
MKLNNLNVVELNAQEVRETEGGILPLLILAAPWVGAGLAWSGIAGSFQQGYNAGQKDK